MKKVTDELAKQLSNFFAEEIDKDVIYQITYPYSKFNDPTGSKKRRKETREQREKKLNRVFKNKTE